MKKILLIVAVGLLMAAQVSGGALTKATSSSKSSITQEDKTKIKKEELPEAARKTLDGDAFKGWTVVNTYKTKSGEYEVELKKDDVSQTVRFDKAGKIT